MLQRVHHLTAPLLLPVVLVTMSPPHSLVRTYGIAQWEYLSLQATHRRCSLTFRLSTEARGSWGGAHSHNRGVRAVRLLETAVDFPDSWNRGTEADQKLSLCPAQPTPLPAAATLRLCPTDGCPWL